MGDYSELLDYWKTFYTAKLDYKASVLPVLVIDYPDAQRIQQTAELS